MRQGLSFLTDFGFDFGLDTVYTELRKPKTMVKMRFLQFCACTNGLIGVVRDIDDGKARICINQSDTPPCRHGHPRGTCTRPSCRSANMCAALRPSRLPTPNAQRMREPVCVCVACGRRDPAVAYESCSVLSVPPHSMLVL